MLQSISANGSPQICKSKLVVMAVSKKYIKKGFSAVY